MDKKTQFNTAFSRYLQARKMAKAAELPIKVLKKQQDALDVKISQLNQQRIDIDTIINEAERKCAAAYTSLTDARKSARSLFFETLPDLTDTAKEDSWDIFVKENT